MSILNTVYNLLFGGYKYIIPVPQYHSPTEKHPYKMGVFRLRAVVNEVRTAIMENKGYIYIPDLQNSTPR